MKEPFKNLKYEIAMIEKVENWMSILTHGLFHKTIKNKLKTYEN